MIHLDGLPSGGHDPKLKLPAVHQVAPVPSETKLAAAQKVLAKTETSPSQSNQSNAPQFNAGPLSNRTSFDKKAYQRDLMRKRRAETKDKV